MDNEFEMMRARGVPAAVVSRAHGELMADRNREFCRVHGLSLRGGGVEDDLGDLDFGDLDFGDLDFGDLGEPVVGLETVAATAQWILFPREGSLYRVQGRWPSGRPIEIAALLLGEEHGEPQGFGGGASMAQVIRIAAARAADAGRCVDVFIEHPLYRPIPAEMEEVFNRMAALVQWLAPLIPEMPTDGRPPPIDPSTIRVHAVDSRPDWLIDEIVDKVSAMINRAIPLDPREERGFDDKRFFMYLTGLEEKAPRFFEYILRDQVFSGSVADTQIWMDLHVAHSQKVRKRARRMPAEDVLHLVNVAYDTIERTEGGLWSDMMASAMDVYLALRMLSEYTNRSELASNGCGAVRSVIVYAGAYHTTHMGRILARLGGLPVLNPTPNTHSSVLRVENIPIVGPGPTDWAFTDTVGRLLEYAALPPSPGHVKVEHHISLPLNGLSQSMQRWDGLESARGLLQSGLYDQTLDDKLTPMIEELLYKLDPTEGDPGEGDPGELARLVRFAVDHAGYNPSAVSMMNLAETMVKVRVNPGLWFPEMLAVRHWSQMVQSAIEKVGTNYDINIDWDVGDMWANLKFDNMVDQSEHLSRVQQAGLRLLESGYMAVLEMGLLDTIPSQTIIARAEHRSDALIGYLRSR